MAVQLERYLDDEGAACARVVLAIAEAGREIAGLLAAGPLAPDLFALRGNAPGGRDAQTGLGPVVN
jgi:hypothetical protein